MQGLLATLPLGAVRAFEAAARHTSIKRAADELGVTPAAVSRQIRTLEGFLGTALFRRRHNAIELTRAGGLLLGVTTPALGAIAGTAARLRRDAMEVVASVPITFASRWLIPRLGAFRARHPRLRLHLATQGGPGAEEAEADVTIRYLRPGEGLDGAHHLFDDLSVPAVGQRTAAADAGWWRQPVLVATLDGWDWQAWAEATGFDPQRLVFGHRLDTDDAAIGAAVAGLGVALVSLPLAADALADGRLHPVADAVALGRYVLVSTAPVDRRAVAQFVAWLTQVGGCTDRSAREVLARNGIRVAVARSAAASD